MYLLLLLKMTIKEVCFFAKYRNFTSAVTKNSLTKDFLSGNFNNGTQKKIKGYSHTLVTIKDLMFL